MKHWIAPLAALVLLFITGCDSMNHSQIQVAPPKGEEKTRVTVASSERQAVKQILTDIATKLRLEDRTDISLIPDTICSYQQPDVKYPLRIIAWVAKNRITIDLFQKPNELGESEAYRKMRDQILAELQKQFGDRLTMIHKMDQVGAGPAASR